MLISGVPTQAVGFVKVRDVQTGELLIEKFNAVNFGNLSEALGQALANRQNGHIHEMVFGNGGTSVSGTGTISYFPPNVTGTDARLYNQTYRKVVDDQSPLNGDTASNNLTVRHTTGNSFSDIIILCTLGYSEPAGQEVYDTATDSQGDYIFDELGIKSYGGRLLTHVIFHPVQKARNRLLEIEYTVRLSLS